jgi:hypothetical protein
VGIPVQPLAARGTQEVAQFEKHLPSAAEAAPFQNKISHCRQPFFSQILEALLSYNFAHS